MLSLIDEVEKSDFLKHKYRTKSFQTNEMMLEAEENLAVVYIVKQGRFKAYSLTENGSKHLIKIYEAGGLLGDIEIFTKRAVICYVEAIEAGEVYMIKGHDFLRWLESDFKISLYMMQQLAKKLYETNFQMQSAANYPLKYQVLLYIWQYIHQHKEYTIPKVFIVEGLASNIRSINRILKQLDDEGMIQNLNGEIEIEELSKVLTMISDYDIELLKRK